MSSWDFWDNLPHLTKMIEVYRRDRDPAPLIRFIKFNPEAMRSPQIGRLFLDILSGRLPPLDHRAGSTSEIRERAINLVLFYIGQDLGKTNAFSQAGYVLNKTSDTIRGYLNTWVKQRITQQLGGGITTKEFWDNLEKHTRDMHAFYDGRVIIDEELARKGAARAGYPDMPIKEYRQIITELYEKGKPVDNGDPWEAAKIEALLDLENQRLKDDKNRE